MRARKIFIFILLSCFIVFSLASCEEIEEYGRLADILKELFGELDEPLDENASSGLLFTLSEDGESYYLQGIGECLDSEVVIPSMYEGKPVTLIASYAFADCEFITSVKLPDTIENISHYAFLGCTGLTSVNIPKSVTKISGAPFVKCGNLKNVDISEENKLFKMQSGCLINISQSTLVQAFDGAIIPSDRSVTKIGIGAFEFCEFITEADIPACVTHIESLAFSQCPNLKSIKIPHSVVSIAQGAFLRCPSLETIDVDYRNIFYISDHNCLINFENIILGTNKSVIPVRDDVWNISSHAFEGLEGIETLLIPSNIVSIQENAIGYSKTLKNVYISKGVVNIFGTQFSGTEGLTVYAEADEIPDGWIDRWNGGGASVVLDYVMPDSEYETAYSEGLDYKLSDDRTYYIVCGMGSCTDENVVIPPIYERLPVRAIEGFANAPIKSIRFPDTLTTINPSSFWSCNSLEEIFISKNVNSIGASVFSYSKSVKSIIVEEGNSVYHSKDNCLIKTAEKILVKGCENSIIPDDGSVESIATYAFAGCEGLKSVNIPNSIRSMEMGCFYGCTSLTEIDIPDSIKLIDLDVFGDCTSLKNVKIPNSVTKISWCSFAGCTELEKLFIPSSVEVIEERAFAGCSKLQLYAEANAIPSGWVISDMSVILGASREE